MSSTKKIDEANEHLQQAEKSLKTSLFKWRPDYDIAADDYTKAATAFRIAKAYDKSIDALMKSVECHKNNKSWFHAAKCYEQIILNLKEKNSLLDIESTANKACSLYQQSGSAEAAASALDKAAKIVEHKHPDVALRLYQHALEVVLIEDSIRHGTEYASKVSRILVKLRMYDQAADALRREIGLNQQTDSFGQIGRLAVALVLVQLGRGDFVAAEKAFKEWGNYCDPQEIQTLETLLQAFDDEDSDLALQALASPFIRHMDVEYAILAKEIQPPSAAKSAPKADVIENATASYVSASTDQKPPSDPKIPSDDEDQGLC